MYTQQLQSYRRFIEKYVKLSEQQWHKIESKRSVRQFKKGDIILHQGEVCKELHFIARGLARAFLVDESGKDFTWNVFFNDENAAVNNLFVIDFKSFLLQEPASFQIEALEELELVSISFSDHKNSMLAFQKGMEFSYKMCNEAYFYLHDLALQRQTKVLKRGLKSLCKKHPFYCTKFPSTI